MDHMPDMKITKFQINFREAWGTFLKCKIAKIAKNST